MVSATTPACIAYCAFGRWASFACFTGLTLTLGVLALSAAGFFFCDAPFFTTLPFDDAIRPYLSVVAAREAAG